jgi:hypothetical protein
MNRRSYADDPVDARSARGWLAGARGGERRAPGTHGVTGGSGASASLVHHGLVHHGLGHHGLGHHGDDRVAGGTVFVPREDGPAVSWLLTEAALASSSE